MDFDRESGINAIIHLQKKLGIDESRENAAKNWNLFTDEEKATTMAAFLMSQESDENS